MSNPTSLLSGKTALVTGAGRGIGAATARALGSHGAAVAVNYFANADAALHVVGDITAAGSPAVAIQADARSPVEVATMVERVIDELGDIDILVCNAIGDTRKLNSKVGRTVPSFIDSDQGIAGIRDAVVSQLDATLTCCRHVVPSIRRKGGGAIVFIGAAITHNSDPAPAEIAVAKAAQDSVARMLAQQLGRDSIRVHNVAPGFVPTDANAGPHQQSIMEHIAIQTPLQPVRACDVANTVVALAGDLTKQLTGLFVPVDGGLTLV
jgi:3-oxoacyl-[acyl-carrier protein] reductase